MKLDRGWSVTGDSVSISMKPSSGAGAASRSTSSSMRRHARLIGGRRVGSRRHVRLRDDQDRLADMVEQDHRVVKIEREIGEPAVIGRGAGQVFGVPDGVVRSIADGAAGEPRQALGR